MWPEIYDFFSITISVILSALSIKLIDDYLDQDIDRHAGRKNLATFLGNGSVVYATLLLCIAAALNATVSMALFFSSYVVGMFTQWNSTFSSRLKGWQEILIVSVLGLVLFGWKIMTFCLLFVFTIQLIDDYVDEYSDKQAGYCNLVHRIGKLECLLIASIALMLAWFLSDQLFPPVAIGTLIFYVGIMKCQEA